MVGGGLGFFIMVVVGGGREWWVGCFCLGEVGYTQ